MNGTKSSNGDHLYEFGAFRVDALQGLFLNNDQPVRVPPKTFELLLFLLKRNNQVVDKESIMAAVWQDTFVEDANLTVHISTLRKIFDGDKSTSARIETFPKIGYRLNADVKIVTNGARSNGHNGYHPVGHETAEHLAESPAVSSKRWALAAGLLVVVLVVSGAGYLGARFLGDPGRSAMEMTRVPGTEQSPSMAISPDGEFLAHAVSKAGKRTLMMTNIRSNSSFELQPANSSFYYGMVFSPDIGWLYFVSGDGKNSDLYKVAILGGPVVKVVENVHHSVDISPDGTRLCFSRRVSPDETAILTAAIDGTDERVLATKRKPERFSASDIAWSPDGRTIATAVSSGQRGQGMQVVGVDVENGAVRPLSNRKWAGVNGVDWLPDGKEVIAGLWETPTSPTHIWTVDVVSGEAKKLTSDLKNYAIANVTRDGGTILTTEHRDESSVWHVPLDAAATARRLTGERHHRYQWIRWTASGQILFASDQGGARNIWIMNEDGTGSRGLTENAGSNYHPVATVDGRYIVFTSDRQQPGLDLWRMGANGENPTRITSGISASQPTLTPDSQWIYFVSGEDAGTKSLARVSVEGGEPQRVIDGLAQWPAISPDGKFIAAYQRANLQDNWKLVILRADDHSQVGSLSLTAGTPIRWMPDGQGIAYLITDESGTSNIWLQPLDGNSARQLTQFTEDQIVNFDISKDGRLICSRTLKLRDAFLIRNFR